MISHRYITGWPDPVEDAYDEVDTDEPWFGNLELESDELFQGGDGSSLYRRRPSRWPPQHLAAERTP